MIEFGRVDAGKSHANFVYHDGVSINHPTPATQHGSRLWRAG
jgi:hypothetical protein